MSAPAVPLAPSSPQNRVDVITEAVPVDDEVKQALLASANELSSSGIDLSEAVDCSIQSLRASGKIGDDVATRLTLANTVANISGDNIGLVKALDADANINSLRDMASRISPSKIENLLSTPTPAAPAGDSDVAPAPTPPLKEELAATISRNLLTLEPTASIRRLARDDQTLVPDSTIRQYVLAFLDHNPSWDISKTSVEDAAKAPGAMDGIPSEYQDRLVEALVKLQLANARGPTPEAVSALAKMNMLQANDFTRVPLKSFLVATKGMLDPEVATETHSNGVSSAMLYEQVLMSLLQAVRGTGLQGIDGSVNIKDRFSIVTEEARARGLHLDFEALFGSNDMCECDDCTTVYSPASYFVDLLNFLRDNNLEDAPSNAMPPNLGDVLSALALRTAMTTKADSLPPLESSNLEKLFRRRPDLAHIELTCENTNVVLPYIDLANEIMESFVLSLGSFKADTNTPKQADIDVHNVGSSTTTQELLTAPQDLNLDAYRELLSAVYPATSLPYSEPMDRIRTFVGRFKLRWEDILQAFRPAMDARETPAQQAMQKIILDRAVTAESLGLVQEEFIILTKEAFWPKAYFDESDTVTLSEYQQDMGVQPAWKHCGYDSESLMLDADATTQNGLMFVKSQLLPRTQLDYETLIEMVETQFVNPWWPDGKNRRMLASLRYSHAFLQTLVDPGAKGSRKYAKVVAYLLKAQILGDLLNILSDDTSSPPNTARSNGNGAKNRCCCDDDMAKWIYDNFENMGKVIVLDAGQGPQLPISGPIFPVLPEGMAVIDPSVKLLPSGAIGTLHIDGSITDANGIVTGQVSILGKAMLLSLANDQLWVDQYKGKVSEFNIAPQANQSLPVGRINATTGEVTTGFEQPALVKWLLNPLNGGGCDITNTKLIHLNGSSLTTDEWDRFHRFVRIHRKLGYTVAETDMAVVSLPCQDPSGDTARPTTTSTPLPNGKGTDVKAPRVSLRDFTHQDPATLSTTSTSPAPKALNADITPFLLSELVAFRKLLDLTNLPVEQLLTFWGPISTSGDNSLYAQLFFRYNILPYDENFSVFRPDENDHYFSSGPDSIKKHLPVLMAALNMKAEDMAADEFDTLQDKLDLESISLMYRYNLLSRVAGIPVRDVAHFIAALQPVSGNPWASANSALSLLTTWQNLQTAGFTFRQLDYIFGGYDDVVDPIQPSLSSVLETTVALTNGLRDINTAYPNRKPDDDKAVASSDVVRTNALLLYGSDTVNKIVALLEGKSVYSTNAPSGLMDKLHIPDSLKSRLTYSDNADTGLAEVRLQGILTEDDSTAAKLALDDLPGAPVVVLTKTAVDKLAAQTTAWSNAIVRLGKQAQTFFDTVLAGVLPEAARAELLAGDLPEQDPAAAVAVTTNGAVDGMTPGKQKHVTATLAPSQGRTPKEKRGVFLDGFIPFLRGHLQRVLVLDAMEGVAGISDRDLISVLLDEVIVFYDDDGSDDGGNGGGDDPKTTTTTTALSRLMSLQDLPPPEPTKWDGWIQPPMDGLYTFYVYSDGKPNPVLVNGGVCPFPHQAAEPTNLWWSGPVQLSASTLATFNSDGNNVNNMQWRTASSAIAPIPSSALLPSFTQSQTNSVFGQLVKASIVTQALSLSADEVRYFNDIFLDQGEKSQRQQQTQQQNGQVSNGVSSDEAKTSKGFSDLTQLQLTKLCAYAALRDSLPPNAPDSLVTLFRWCRNNPTKGGDPLAAQIHRATGWDSSLVVTIVTGVNYANLVPSSFTDEANLVKLQLLLKVAGQVGVNVERIFDWTTPRTVSRSWETVQTAADIQKALRSRFDTQAWQKVAQPLNDTLREHRQSALVSYLLVQDVVKAQGVIDADSLFEFFLIDVQMTSLVQTTRIKQAISTVQLFIQRVLLGLEASISGLSSDAISADRWEWMQKYVLWEANRKVFLYPENYLDPTLRDDKSPFFRELEADLLSKDITKDNMVTALKSYVYKLDQVANLQPIAIHNSSSGKFYIFSRTYAAPYSYYWRSFDAGPGNWSPWEQMQIDVPDYKVAGKNLADLGRNGCYLIPYEWNNRLLLFIPQIVKTTVTQPAPMVTTDVPIGEAHVKVTTKANFVQLGNETVDTNGAVDMWEIGMAWTEYRGGKWLPKQLSPSTFTASSLYDIDTFSFLPAVVGDTPETLSITVSTALVNTNAAFVTQFSFNGGEMKIATTPKPSSNNLPVMPRTNFEQLQTANGGRSVSSLQGVLTPWSTFAFSSSTVPSLPEVDFSDPASTLPAIKYKVGVDAEPFYHKYAPKLLSRLLATDSLSEVFTFLSSGIDAIDYPSVFGQDDNGDFHEQNNPYALYNWELGFHVPMLLADRLLKAQKYDTALEMLRYVFNPVGKGVDKDPTRAWVFTPFRLERTQTLRRYFTGLLPGHSNALVTEWRKNPFDPFVVARSRPVAYMKWAVMKYIEVLIEYGDYYFMQNSLESIPSAIQLYVTASHLYGPRGQKIQQQRPTKAQTYSSLQDQWDAFGNATVQLELAFPFSNQTPLPVGVIPSSQAEMMRSMLGNIFGSASTLYFGIPDNPTQRQLGSRIDDRLFKIRHSQDIGGVFRQLPMWDPPIDPMMLVRAAAKGVKLSSVLADMSGPMPNYRFVYLLGKAFEACSQLSSLGSGFLSAKEKGDSEALGLLRQKHEMAVQAAVMDSKKLALGDAQKSLETLQFNRKSPVYKLQYYLTLLGADPSSIPAVDAEFVELVNQIDQPAKGSSLALSPFEAEEMAVSSKSQDFQTVVGAIETLSGVFLALPTANSHATPLGVGVAVEYGPEFVGHAMSASARALKTVGDQMAWQASNAGRKAANQKQYQDRVMQANSAGYEIKNIDRQVLSAEIRIQMAQKDIDLQQKSIDQAREVNEFLINKYSNVQLYGWMETTTRNLYYQTYTLAYGMAKKAEQVFGLERPAEVDEGNPFIQPGYWDASRDGLLASEQLYLGLKNLEAAYQAKRGHDFEITKNISLRHIDPVQLLTLRETGSCTFELPELLFDMDFPGHYMRQIRSVSVTMPCIVGPYVSVNATLRLSQHRYRVDPSSAAPYAEHTSNTGTGTDSRFRTSNVPIATIAVSTGQSDAGLFELDFKAERFLPFEGAGAISRWELKLLSPVRQFDYSSLTDVVLHLRYTALDGGDALARPATQYVTQVLGQAQAAAAVNGMAVVYDVKADFATEWYRAASAAEGAVAVVSMAELARKMPVATPGARVGLAEVSLLTDAEAVPKLVEVVSKAGKEGDGRTVVWSGAGVDVGDGDMKLYKGSLSGWSMNRWEIRGRSDDFGAGRRMWLVVRYTVALPKKK